MNEDTLNIPVSDFPSWILEPIKSTKSVIMEGDKDKVLLRIKADNAEIYIPGKVVFQVLRGLVSYTQKYYRKEQHGRK